MSNQDKVTQKPLLYIVQPKGEEVQASMQAYSVNKKEEQSKKQEVQPVEQSSETVQTTDKVTKPDKKKQFRDMTILEKIGYLTSLPSQMPNMKCEVRTESEQFRGFIHSYQNQSIQMKTFQRPFRAEIPIDEIEDIRLLGF